MVTQNTHLDEDLAIVPDSGLAYKGLVTAVPGANQFTIASLAGLGAGKFDGPTEPYLAFVQRKGTGTGLAPQGESHIVTAYDTNTGNFTSPGFSVPIAIDDEVMIMNPAFIVGGGSPVPKLYIGDLTISANTTDDNDVVITDNLTVNAGITYTVKGDLQVNGNITLQAGASLIYLNLDCGGALNANVVNASLISSGENCHFGSNISLGSGTSITASGTVTVNGVVTLNTNSSINCTTLVADALITCHSGAQINANVIAYGGLTVNSTAAISGYLHQVIGGNLINTGSITGTVIFKAGPAVGTPLIDFQISVGAGFITKVVMQNPLLTIKDMIAGDVIGAIVIKAGETLTLDATCTGGHVTLYGTGSLVDNSGGAVTVVDNRIPNGGSGFGANSLEVIYFDPVNGNTLASGNDGSPTKPLSLEADVLTQIAAKKLSRIKIVTSEGHGYPGFAAPADMTGLAICGEGEDEGFQPSNHNIDGSEFHDLYLFGSNGPGGYSAAYNCIIQLIDSNGWDFYDCTVRAYTGPAASTADFFNCTFNNATITISPGLSVVLLGTGDVHVDGSAGSIRISGNIQYGSIVGAVVINDHTNKPNVENAVNITAIVASETNFLNLATAGFHYTVDDLVLKCADPGANTVNVKLYKLVNGASTLIHTFAIVTGAVALSRGVTGGFGLYLGLDDMFTRTQLAGDNIKITVQATGGGPYAVTGSYAARSA